MTRHAAAFGVADVATYLGGLVYAGDEGVAVDYVATLRWYDAAAAGWSAVGATAAAAMIAAGLGGPASDEGTLARYTDAVSLGSVAAARELGGMNRRAEGAPVDRYAARRV